MISRTFLAFLVFALPILVVTFGVLMAAYALALATGDAVGAGILWWVAMASLMLLAVNFIVLVASLGLITLESRENPRHDRHDRPD